MIPRKKKDRSRTKINISPGDMRPSSVTFVRPDPIFEEPDIIEEPSTSTPSPYDAIEVEFNQPQPRQFKYREPIKQTIKEPSKVDWMGVYGLLSDAKKSRDLRQTYNEELKKAITEKNTDPIEKIEKIAKVEYGSNDEYKYNTSVLQKLEDQSPYEQIKYIQTPVSDVQLSVTYGTADSKGETGKIRDFFNKEMIIAKETETPRTQMATIIDEKKYDPASIGRINNDTYYRTTGEATGIKYNQPRYYRTTGEATGITYNQQKDERYLPYGSIFGIIEDPYAPVQRPDIRIPDQSYRPYGTMSSLQDMSASLDAPERQVMRDD